METEIKIVGEMDYIFREDRSVFDTSGLCPTLKTSNYERKILVELGDDKSETDRVSV